MKMIINKSWLLIVFFTIMLGTISISGQNNIKEKLQNTQDSIQKYIYKNPDVAFSYAFKYDSIANNQDSIKYKGKGKNFLGMMYYIKGDVENAIENYLLSQEVFEKLGDKWFVSMLHNNIGAAYQFRKQPLVTIEYYEKALEGFTELNDTLWMANLLNNISIQKGELGQYAEELAFKNRALEIYYKRNDSEMIMLTKGNLVDTYFKLGNYDKAEKLAIEYLNSPFSESNQALSSSVYLAYSYALLKKNQIEHSLLQAEKAESIAEDLGLHENLIKVHKHLAEIYAFKKDFKNAYVQFQSFYHLQDSLFNQQKDKTINELLVKYETGKKENQINLLTTQNELKDLKIVRASSQRWGMGFAILALALIAFFAFRLQRLKAAANTELENKNKLITKALDEKNILLREIHHRVKNNLQVISSLLKLQSQYIEDENAVKAIADGRNRVHSMAILHQNLYQEDNITGVDMQQYFTGLIEGLFEAYNISSDKVGLETNIQNLRLDIDTVIPLGLIANELVSNALKHAFENVENALLQVKLWEEGGHLFFKVKDNGIGYNAAHTAEFKKSFGQKLIRSLSDKLEADIEIISDKGTDVILKIKDYKKAA